MFPSKTLELKCLRDTAQAQMSSAREMNGCICEVPSGRETPWIATASPPLPMAHSSGWSIACSLAGGSTCLLYTNEMRYRGWELRVSSASSRQEVSVAAMDCRLEHVFVSFGIAIEIIQVSCGFGRRTVDVLLPRGTPTLVSSCNGCAPHIWHWCLETSRDACRGTVGANAAYVPFSCIFLKDFLTLAVGVEAGSLLGLCGSRRWHLRCLRSAGGLQRRQRCR
jgi:hypothetical protein